MHEMVAHTDFLVSNILFLLHSLARNILAAKSILSSPERNKIVLQSRKLLATEEEKSIFLLLQQNQSIPVYKR